MVAQKPIYPVFKVRPSVDDWVFRAVDYPWRYTLIIRIFRVMARTKGLQLLLSEEEYSLLKVFAESKQIPMSEVLRDYIKTFKKSP